MNRKLILGISAGAAALLAAGLLFLFGTVRVPAEAESSPSAPAYSLREHEGKLAVFETGREEPLRILDLDVRMLPPYDQGLLRAGIDAADERELARLLEDYTS